MLGIESWDEHRTVFRSTAVLMYSIQMRFKPPESRAVLGYKSCFLGSVVYFYVVYLGTASQGESQFQKSASKII